MSTVRHTWEGLYEHGGAVLNLLQLHVDPVVLVDGPTPHVCNETRTRDVPSTRPAPRHACCVGGSSAQWDRREDLTCEISSTPLLFFSRSARKLLSLDLSHNNGRRVVEVVRSVWPRDWLRQRPVGWELEHGHGREGRGETKHGAGVCCTNTAPHQPRYKSGEMVEPRTPC